MGMNLEQTVLRHPARQELVAFAESLVDRSSRVSAFLAAHVNSCPRCTAEVRAIRASLEFTASASAPEPSGAFFRFPPEISRRSATFFFRARLTGYHEEKKGTRYEHTRKTL